MDTAPFMVPIPAVRHPCQLGLDDQCQGSSSSATNYYHCRQHIFLSARRKPGPFSDICCALLFHPWSSVSVPNSCLLPVRCSYVTALLYMYLHCISASISLADILYCCIQPYWAVKYVYVCSIYCCCL